MDPLSIQMVMGSPPPPILHGKISLSDLMRRKKRTPENCTSLLTQIPSALQKIDEISQSTPTKQDTVRTRRGFRPLSVFTNSILIPFESETLKAMQELEDKEDVVATDSRECIAGTTSGVTKQPSISIDESPDSDETLPKSNDSEISLRAFLEQSSPSLKVPRLVKDSLSDLYQIPAPDVSQHPAFSADPFASRSDIPSLITTTTADEIRRFAAQVRSNSSQPTNRSSGSSDIFGSTERKKFSFTERLQSPGTPSSRVRTPTIESSPLTKHNPKSRPIEVIYHNQDTPNSDAEKRRNTSGGLRKLSDMFKTRVSIETSSLATPSTIDESPRATIKAMEIYLRKVTCSPTYQYTDNSWLPQHPNTGRFWRSRNLKCTNCINVGCACCGRICCAYKAAVMALDTHKDNPQGRASAIERIQQITMIFPYGRELPTFLRCTKGSGDGAGCGKLVCPDCCGVCPDEVCADIQCRKCKKNPWVECDWHTNLTQLASLSVGNSNSNNNIRHTV